MTQGGWEGEERSRAAVGRGSLWLSEQEHFSVCFWSPLAPSLVSLLGTR